MLNLNHPRHPRRPSTVALALCALVAAASAAAPALAQEAPPTKVKTMRLSGPRVGMSFLQGRSYEALREHIGPSAYPFAMVLGWQFEYAWLSGADGTAGLFEFVPTVAGFNQGAFVPGINMLIGVRSASGFEGAMGGQLTIGGKDMFSLGALFAVGGAIRTTSLNFPIHLVWVTGRDSNRVALMFGFSGVDEPSPPVVHRSERSMLQH